MEEVWKDIEGYEGFYQVSNIGRVRSLDRMVWSKRYKGYYPRKGRVLSLATDSDGYKFAGLSKEGKTKPSKVHRLVASAFIPNPLNLPVINHKNEIRNDNRVENLEWCTVKYNTNYGNARLKLYHAQRKSIIAKSMNGGPSLIFESIRDAGFKGFNEGHISECCNGKRPFHKGYYWSFL